MHAILETPLGMIGLVTAGDEITRLHYLDNTHQTLAPTNSTAERAVLALNRYFNDPEYLLELPMAPLGTAFQLKVWRALVRIPQGQTLTYGELAKQLKSAPRAVGQACKRNPLPIFIPCHRVVAANHLGGYSGHRSGSMMDIKTWLLNHENSGDRIESK